MNLSLSLSLADFDIAIFNRSPNPPIDVDVSLQSHFSNHSLEDYDRISSLGGLVEAIKNHFGISFTNLSNFCGRRRGGRRRKTRKIYEK